MGTNWELGPSGWGVPTDSRFPFQAPSHRSSPGAVTVRPDGSIHVEHRLVPGGLLLPADSVLGVVTQSRDDVPLLAREPRILRLVSTLSSEPTVAVVLREPLRAGPFDAGSASALGITAGERKRGLDLDALVLELGDPMGCAEALRRAGVPILPSLGEALADRIGRVDGAAADARARQRRAANRAARSRIIAGAAVVAPLVAAMIVRPFHADWSVVARVGVGAVAFTVLAVGALALLLPHHGRRPARWWTLTLVAAAVLPGVAAPWVLDEALLLPGPEDVLIAGALGGLPAGCLAWIALRSSSALRSADQPRRPGLVIASLLAATVFLGSAVVGDIEHSDRQIAIAASDVGEAFPDGWLECCGGAAAHLSGDQLDEHICGTRAGSVPPHTAGAVRAFELADARRPGSRAGQVQVTVLLAPTEADAAREFDAVDHPDYPACTSSSVGRTASQFWTAASGPAQVEYFGRGPVIDVGPSGEAVVDVFEIVVPVGEGQGRVVAAFVRMRIGRAIVRMPMLDFADSGLGPTLTAFQDFAEAVGQHVLDTVE